MAKQLVAERNQRAGEALRAEKDRLFHRDLAREMENEPRATAEEIRELSSLLNVAQRSVVPPWETPSWFKLFKVVDADGSGLISYAEFLDMCRDILKLSEHMAPEPRLKALWLALDEDCSGYLTSGEFGSFMRLSAEKVNGAGKARQSVIDRNQRIAEELRLEKDRMFHRDIAREMENEPRASADEIRELSELFNVAQRAVVPPWEMPSWFKLFKHVDADGSGLIDYDELTEVVRGILRLTEDQLSEARLKALWLALDEDGSGHLSSGEFGMFMNIGKPVVERMSPLEHRRLLSVEARLDGEAVSAEDARLQAAKEERDLVPTQVRVNTMAERLRQSPHYSPRDPTAAGDAAMGPTERKKKFATTLDIEEWLEREFQQWRNETGGVSPRVMAEIPTRAPPGYRAFGWSIFSNLMSAVRCAKWRSKGTAGHRPCRARPLSRSHPTWRTSTRLSEQSSSASLARRSSSSHRRATSRRRRKKDG